MAKTINPDRDCSRMLVFVIGAPGSGKGTLCRKLCSEFGYSHLSVGDYLRNMVANSSKLLEQHVIDRILSGELLSIEDLFPILQTAVSRLNMEGNQVVVVDGFPRDIEQVNFLSGTNFQPHVVLLFDCPGDIARDRYLHRDIAGRDKSPAIFARRYVEFVRLNQAVLEAFKEMGVLLTVDTGRETETSYKHLLKALQESKYNLC